MCNIACVQFGARAIRPSEVEGRRVLEVGSIDVNGSLRPILEAWKPSEYIGVDVTTGPGVDRVCHAENLVEEFGENSFDLVIATEIIEHVQDWRTVISNLKNVCRPTGIILITTPSHGFPYHAYPHDFWRYDSQDMRQIFRDCAIEVVEDNRPTKQVFLKARKPEGFHEADLSTYELSSIVTGTRIAEITNDVLKKEQRKKRFFETVTLRVMRLAQVVTRRVLHAQ